MPTPHDRIGREADDMLPRSRDRVGDGRREEPRGRRPEDAEERVHEDLRRLRRDRVPGPLGRRALGPQTRHEPGENALLAREGCPARRPHDSAIVGRLDVGEGVDVERANEARIETREIEHQHVAMDAGYGREHEATHDRGRPRNRFADVDARRHPTASAQFA